MVPPAASIDMLNVFADTGISTFTLPPQRLTIQNVAKRRAASGKLIAGAVAAADLELFKGRRSHGHKPLAKRWDHRLSLETASRCGSSLKNAAVFLKNPGLISLGGGLPSSEYFPVNEIVVKVPKLGYCARLHDGYAGSELLRAGMHDMAEGKSAFDISIAAQYGLGHGAPQLLRWLVEHTEIIHNPPYQDWSCTMTVGSTMAWDMILRMMTKPGDWVLGEEFTFTTAVESAAPMGVRMAAVRMDTQGMIPASLDHILTNWDERARGGPKPFLVYTVPTGQNPTGSTQPMERRRQIYAVAQKHDLYIFEDEPYYFLQMQEYKGRDASPVPPPTSHEEFLKSLVPSFLSIDTDGRVMRVDSFSKVVAPGSRLGWITASEQICERYRTHADFCTQGPSGFSQLILFKLLDESWGHAGYLDWLIHMRLEYTRRRNVMLEACERYLPRKIVSWVPPMAGMFHWMELDYTQHPHYLQKSLEVIEEEIFLTIVEHGTLLMKGSWFRAERDRPLGRLFFRATYAAAEFDQIDEAIRRFGDAVRESFGIFERTSGLPEVHYAGGNVSGHTNGYSNGHTNVCTNGHTVGLLKALANGYTNGCTNGVHGRHGLIMTASGS